MLTSAPRCSFCIFVHLLIIFIFQDKPYTLKFYDFLEFLCWGVGIYVSTMCPVSGILITLEVVIEELKLEMGVSNIFLCTLNILHVMSLISLKTNQPTPTKP